MRTVDLSQVSDQARDASTALAARAGVDLKDCYQCGKCSAGCPMVQGMDLMPREVLRLLQLGLLDEVLQAKTPWLCAQCEVCASRCPQEIQIAALMREVRYASKAAGYQPYPESDKFDDLFIAGVRSKGKSNEQYLAMKYNFSSGHLFQDVLGAPGMFSRGMIGVSTHSVKDTEAVRRLIDKCGGER